VPPSPAVVRAAGLALGVVADAALGDPARGHPVAAFGRLVTGLERRLYADAVAPGAALVGLALAGPVLGGIAVERLTRRRPLVGVVATAAATWAVLGGASLAREGDVMGRLLDDGDLPAARARLPHLCARDPSGLDGDGLARATVESLAENTSDAVVAPLLWGAVGGVPGLLA
jgi:adenosylcobinamide-phosphate synthase